MDTLIAMVPHYGLWIVLAATYLSCLAVPVPTSLIMLTAGAFSAAGDLVLSTTAAGAFAGAVAGDQTGFAIGRRGAGTLARLEARSRKSAEALARARTFTGRWGGPGVFFSRWLLSPLGPYVNFVTGAAGMGWARFTAFGVAGEAVWVAGYLGLGYLFADQIEAVADIAGNLSGTLAAGAVTVLSGLWLMSALRAERRRHRQG